MATTKKKKKAATKRPTPVAAAKKKTSRAVKARATPEYGRRADLPRTAVRSWLQTAVRVARKKA